MNESQDMKGNQETEPNRQVPVYADSADVAKKADLDRIDSRNNQRFSEVRADMNRGFDKTDQRISEVQTEMRQGFADLKTDRQKRSDKRHGMISE